MPPFAEQPLDTKLVGNAIAGLKPLERFHRIVRVTLTEGKPRCRREARYEARPAAHTSPERTS